MPEIPVYDTEVYVLYPGTYRARGRHGKTHTYKRHVHYTIPLERARETARKATADGEAIFVKVTLADGRVFCWTPERGWWEKRTSH